MYTYIAQDTASCDHKSFYSVYVRGSMKLNNSFVDESRKLVKVTIFYRDSTNAFEKMFEISGSDVRWEFVRSHGDKVSIIFYDFGPNKPAASGDGEHAVPNYYLFSVKCDPIAGDIRMTNELSFRSRLEWTNNVLKWDGTE
jgi:hypothetical protein